MSSETSIMKNFVGLVQLSWVICTTIMTQASGGQVDYKDCGSNANITELRLTDCTEPPCILYKGSTYEVEIDAVSKSSSTKLPYKVQLESFIPITILKGNACDVLSKGSCPVQSGMEFTYKNTIAVEKHYPSIHSKVKATVLDDKNNILICVTFDVEITSKTSESGEVYWKRLIKKLQVLRALQKGNDGLYYNYRI